MYEGAIGCWVSRYALEGEMGRPLTDEEWKLAFLSIDSDAVEDAIVDLVRYVLANGSLMPEGGRGGEDA